jgi:hypothetical protein
MANDLGFSYVRTVEKKKEDENTLQIVLEGGLPDCRFEGPSAFMSMPIPPEYNQAWEEYEKALRLVETLAEKIETLEQHYKALNKLKEYNPNV